MVTHSVYMCSLYMLYSMIITVEYIHPGTWALATAIQFLDNRGMSHKNA